MKLTNIYLTMVGALAVLACSKPACADMVIFTLEQIGGQADISLGDVAHFRILINAQTTAVSDIDGIDVTIGADDDGTAMDSGNRLAGGHFIAASTPLFGNFSIGPPTSILAFTGTGFPGNNLGTAPVELASFDLDTSGATPGTYEMSLQNILVLNTSFGMINVDYGNVDGLIFYTIVPVAVPEPTCIALAGLALVSGLPVFRRRRGQSKFA